MKPDEPWIFMEFLYHRLLSHQTVHPNPLSVKLFASTA